MRVRIGDGEVIIDLLSVLEPYDRTQSRGSP